MAKLSNKDQQEPDSLLHDQLEQHLIGMYS